jgi:hypothetical protein
MKSRRRMQSSPRALGTRLEKNYHISICGCEPVWELSQGWAGRPRVGRHGFWLSGAGDAATSYRAFLPFSWPVEKSHVSLAHLERWDRSLMTVMCPA